MIRAMILALLGATFEVRVINTKSGKDIPGTRICKGGYWTCRKATHNRNLKYGEVIRLQAISILEWDVNDTKPRDDAIAEVESVVGLPDDMVIVENPMADGMPSLVVINKIEDNIAAKIKQIMKSDPK